MTPPASSQLSAEPAQSEAGTARATPVSTTYSGSELRPITWTSAALAVLIFALWGGNAVSVRLTQDAFPPIGTAALRFALGTLMMASWAAWTGATFKVARQEWGYIVWVGFLTYVHIGLFHWGLTATNSAHASVLVAAHPVVVAILANYLLPGDQLTWLKSAGLAIATGGVCVMVFMGNTLTPGHTPRDHVTLVGDLVIVASGILLAVRIVATKFAMASVNAGKLTLWSNVVGTLLFVVTTLLFEEHSAYHWTWASGAALLYQGVVVSGFCFFMYAVLLQRHPASQLAVFSFVQPLFGILTGWWFRNDHISSWLLVGGAGVAAGVALVNLPSNTQPSSDPLGDATERAAVDAAVEVVPVDQLAADRVAERASVRSTEAAG